METIEKTTITVVVKINARIEKVWTCFNEPKHIVSWNSASPDWHTPYAQNDFYEGGRFDFRMEARNGSHGFNFTGVYIKIEPYRYIEYKMDDERKVQVVFEPVNGETKVVETFEAEQTYSIDLQRQGWQMILNNFKSYVEQSVKPCKLHYEVIIDAPAETVYSLMLGHHTYSEWTSVFNPASRYEGTWEKDSIIHFIGEDEKGNKGGMVSRIKEHIPNRFVSIEHFGVLQDDMEVTSGPEVEKWAGSLEDYSFEEQNGKTIVKIDVDVADEYITFFNDTWPKALNKLKEICETKGR